MSDKEDMFLVKLLGLDRRYLMKKSFKEADLSTML